MQDGRDGAVAAAESERPGADCRGHGGHHEGLQGRLTSHEGLTQEDLRRTSQGRVENQIRVTKAVINRDEDTEVANQNQLFPSCQ